MSILFPSNTTETTTKVDALKRGEVVHFIDMKHDSGQSATFNPIQSELHNIDAAMGLLNTIAGGGTEDSVLSRAKEVLAGVASNGGEVTMHKVVMAFEAVPELGNFASVLRKASLPGEYGRYFDSLPAEAKMPEGWTVDVSMLNHECLAVVIQWAHSQAVKSSAQSALAKVLAQIKFDITAAELGALLHAPGNA